MIIGREKVDEMLNKHPGRAQLLCDTINRMGSGAHPFAEVHTLAYFERDYAVECVQKAIPHLSPEGKTLAEELIADLKTH